MAIAIDPWILDKLCHQYGEKTVEPLRTRSKATRYPRVQFLEALKTPVVNPDVRAGCQCHLNDTHHTVLAVITAEAEARLRDDPESSVPLPFSVPKLKGYIVRLKSFSIEKYIEKNSVQKSGFIVVVDELEVVTSERQSAIGKPEFIEDVEQVKRILCALCAAARSRNDAAAALPPPPVSGTQLLAYLDHGPSQMDADPATALEELRAIAFATHPREQAQLDAIVPPDPPCSLPTFSQGFFVASSCSDGEHSAGVDSQPASARHFSPRQRDAASDAAASSLGLASAAVRTAGAASAAACPLRPGGCRDGCALDQQEVVDMSGKSSSGSTLPCSGVPLEHTPPTTTVAAAERRVGPDSDADSSTDTASSKYHTASERDSPAPRRGRSRLASGSGSGERVPRSNLLDSPSMRLRRPPRRASSRCGAQAAAEAEQKLRATEVRLAKVFDVPEGRQHMATDSGLSADDEDDQHAGHGRDRERSPRRPTLRSAGAATLEQPRQGGDGGSAVSPRKRKRVQDASSGEDYAGATGVDGCPGGGGKRRLMSGGSDAPVPIAPSETSNSRRGSAVTAAATAQRRHGDTSDDSNPLDSRRFGGGDDPAFAKFDSGGGSVPSTRPFFVDDASAGDTAASAAARSQAQSAAAGSPDGGGDFNPFNSPVCLQSQYATVGHRSTELESSQPVLASSQGVAADVYYVSSTQDSGVPTGCRQSPIGVPSGGAAENPRVEPISVSRSSAPNGRGAASSKSLAPAAGKVLTRQPPTGIEGLLQYVRAINLPDCEASGILAAPSLPDSVTSSDEGDGSDSEMEVSRLVREIRRAQRYLRQSERWQREGGAPEAKDCVRALAVANRDARRLETAFWVHGIYLM